jgi:hypothetical protein
MDRGHEAKCQDAEREILDHKAPYILFDKLHDGDKESERKKNREGKNEMWVLMWSGCG